MFLTPVNRSVKKMLMIAFYLDMSEKCATFAVWEQNVQKAKRPLRCPQRVQTNKTTNEIDREICQSAWA